MIILLSICATGGAAIVAAVIGLWLTRDKGQRASGFRPEPSEDTQPARHARPAAPFWLTEAETAAMYPGFGQWDGRLMTSPAAFRTLRS